MSEMVERVAAAIERANDSAPSFGMKVSDIIKLMARAAIEAMREPTKDMLAAVKMPDQQLVEDWQAMIDEALKSNTQYR